MSHLQINDLIATISSSSSFQNLPKASAASKSLLLKLYQTMKGPDAKSMQKISDPSNDNLKLPILISFHPKLSLLNNNVHESLLSMHLAKNLGMIPLWIPYVYDTATHSSAGGGKIRAPTYAYIEEKFIQLRSAAQIHGNIIKTESKINKKELTAFFLELEKHLIDMLGQLQRFLNPFNFGHPLFDLKLKAMQFNKKKLRKSLQDLQPIFESTIGESKNLGEYLGIVSQKLLDRLGIRMNLAFIEHVMEDIIPPILNAISQQSHIQDDPSQMAGLFVYYDQKTKNRIPIEFTGDSFIAIDDNANRFFDGNAEDLAEAVGKNLILPTGPALILMFCALGVPITLGGLHTQEYYPDYIKNAQNLLKTTDYSCNMQVLGYGNVRALDTTTMTDILAVHRIFEKVGSRTVVKKGSLSLPHDVVDHLNFLGGKQTVPMEYYEVLEKLIKDQKESKPALEKEQERNAEINRWSNLTGEDLFKIRAELQSHFRGVNLDELHPERLKFMVENLALDANMRLERLQQNLALEQHLLGGNIALEEASADFEDGSGQLYNEYGEPLRVDEIYSGVIIRSKRVPTLLELVFYQIPVDLIFQSPVYFENTDTPYYLGLIIAEKKKIQQFLPETESLLVQNYIDSAESLLNSKSLPFFLRDGSEKGSKK